MIQKQKKSCFLNYDSSIKYPPDWHFLKEGYSPPPPRSIMLSSIKNPYPPAGTDHLSLGVDVDEAFGRTLENSSNVYLY